VGGAGGAVNHPLLDLQAADTHADQLRHRRANLPERDALAHAQAELDAWRRRRDGLQARIAELEAQIERNEAESHEIDKHKARLEQQMKTIIAPREAEALQHEIALLDERRSGLDDVELEALEEQSSLADQIAAMAAEEPPLSDTVAAAIDAASAADVEIDVELAAIAGRLDGLRAAVDAGLLTRYDRARTQQMVAAAELQGHRCSGCHLDLAPGELDAVKADAATSAGVTDCPNCNRLLVLG
jgi:uncharacterized protein